MARLLFSVLGSLLCLACSASAEPLEGKGYSIPTPATGISFPRDHGAHPDFRTEWWYLTGHLVRKGGDPFKDGTDFGFQITFFRRGVGQSPASSDWGEQYLAHAAVSDIEKNRFQFEKRYIRGGVPIASASTTGLDVRNGPWSMMLSDGGFRTDFSVQKKGTPSYQVSLRANVVPEPLRHGQSGFSRKGRCEGCASMYYSLPAIRFDGEILRGDQRIPVEGLGWLDHEWMSGAIDPNQVGWDWISLMHRDGKSVMLFQLRDKAGKVDFGSGTILSGDGQTTLSPSEFSIRSQNTWKSPVTGNRYPSGWQVMLPGGPEINLTPLLPDQELSGAGNEYWEGAITSSDRAWIGYAELTGYGKPVGRF